MLWLLRTRNVDDPKNIAPKTIASLLKGIGADNLVLSSKKSSRVFGGRALLRSELIALINAFDSALAKQEHEVSLYAEDFQGEGTAFGETFDMHALTAAHRTFPGNTLVKVKNVANGKSVLVRINDRGPYVKGRDMDLSLNAFTAIADRSEGKIHATFERLGDRSLVRPCVGIPAYQSRITKSVRLIKGVPRLLTLGDTVTLRSASTFIVEEVRNPDGTIDSSHQWIAPGTRYAITPSSEGLFDVVLGAKDGTRKTMEMQVMDCGRTR
ncbi:septal ring lytic transglycosylase RlpA family protein [Candidatus Peregrinibacteria bacterium]|nr:septal ring lytic transglycosylase RlpA family protein [Candidatus Peregrinibacteria bacterium]MBI3816423.1 septal ring lytic transglycosylase RlpA family protein [Candidatus Peregrinibacteria bacterium]